MPSLNTPLRRRQALLAPLALALLTAALTAAESAPSSDAEAKTAAEMKPYIETIRGTDVSFKMVPIPGGTFVMGSPENEPGRNPDEGPQHKVTVEPFWMGAHEVTWDEYDIWSFGLDLNRRKALQQPTTERDKLSDAVTKPTAPYTDMTFGMGHDSYPASCMTQLAAKMYCVWLTAKTGHYYRLPTEAEWEFACRAGTNGAYSFGNDASKLNEHAWHAENSEESYHKVGMKKPNPWGLYDIHGNVAEWCLDQYYPDYYATCTKGAKEPIVSPLAVMKERYPHTVRGGSWMDPPEMLRSAARVASTLDWKMQDPQIPQSVWYHTDASHVGFRVVRPLRVPTEKEQKELRLVPQPEDLIRK